MREVLSLILFVTFVLGLIFLMSGNPSLFDTMHAAALRHFAAP